MDLSRMTHLLNKHEALGIRDDLRGIESLLQVLNESLLVAGELGGGATEELAGTATVGLEGTQTTGEDGLSDQGDRHAQVQGVDGSPLASALLAGLVEDLLNQRSAVVIVVAENVAGDLDQEGVQDTAVPLVENVRDLGDRHSEATFHDIVRLCRLALPFEG